VFEAVEMVTFEIFFVYMLGDRKGIAVSAPPRLNVRVRIALQCAFWAGIIIMMTGEWNHSPVHYGTLLSGAAPIAMVPFNGLPRCRFTHCRRSTRHNTEGTLSASAGRSTDKKSTTINNPMLTLPLNREGS
jgi:hypothetical protein